MIIIIFIFYILIIPMLQLASHSLDGCISHQKIAKTCQIIVKFDVKLSLDWVLQKYYQFFMIDVVLFQVLIDGCENYFV